MVPDNFGLAILNIDYKGSGFPTPSGGSAVGKLRQQFNHLENPVIKKLALVLSLTFATATMAADMSCNAGAMEKKLVGAAKTSFLKKCEKDAAATCDAAAKEKKLAGAAKNSFTKKCVKDAVG
jgi:hypothetical protein